MVIVVGVYCLPSLCLLTHCDLLCPVVSVFCSESTMETQKERQKPANGQLISVPHKDTIRLLEVYVKRSLSLNDGALEGKGSRRKEKWVTLPKKQRRHSSDPSLHLVEESNNEDGAARKAHEACPRDLSEPFPKEPGKPSKKSKRVKAKKPAFWKNLVNFFSWRSNDDKDDEVDSPKEMSEVSEVTTTCLPTAGPPSEKKSTRRKSLKRRLSMKRLSIIKPHKPSKDLNHADITSVEGQCDSENYPIRQKCAVTACEVNVFLTVALQLLSAWSRHTLTTRKWRKNWRKSCTRSKKKRKLRRFRMVRKCAETIYSNTVWVLLTADVSNERETCIWLTLAIFTRTVMFI